MPPSCFHIIVYPICHFLLFPDFNVFHMIAVGLSSSILGCLVTLLVYTYCQRYQQQSHDATVIHPISAAPLNTSITNHINKLDKYDSVEAIKVRIICSHYQWPVLKIESSLCDLFLMSAIESESVHAFIHCFLISDQVFCVVSVYVFKLYSEI